MKKGEGRLDFWVTARGIETNICVKTENVLKP